MARSLPFRACVAIGCLAGPLLFGSCDHPVAFENDNPKDPLSGDFRPDEPRDLDGELVGDEEVRLTWTSTSSPLSEAEVERRVGEGDFLEVGTVPMEDGEFVDRWKVPPYVPFRYRVTARSGDHSSDPVSSPELSFDFESPDSLEVAQLNDSAAALGWRYEGTLHEEFVVERRHGAEGAFAEIGRVGAEKREYRDATLDPSLRYRFRVRAATDRYKSRASDELRIHHAHAVKVLDQVLADPIVTYQTVAMDEEARYALRGHRQAGTYHLVDLDSEEELYSFQPPDGGTRQVELHREHGVLVLLGFHGFQIRELTTGEVIREPEATGHIGSPYCGFALSPEGTMLVAALCREPTVEWLRVDDGDVAKSYENLPGTVGTLDFSSDGRRLYLGWHDSNYPYENGIQAWDTGTDEVVLNLEVECAPAHASVEPTDRFLAVSTHFGCSSDVEEEVGINLWALETAERIILENTLPDFDEVDFNHDGELLIGHRSDGLHLWSTETGEYLGLEARGRRPFLSKVEDRLVFRGGVYLNIARTGPFWTEERQAAEPGA